MNKLLMKAASFTNTVISRVKGAFTKREKGLSEIVIILIIIAVAAGLIGAFYLWSKASLLPAVERQINDSISEWFKPN